MIVGLKYCQILRIGPKCLKASKRNATHCDNSWLLTEILQNNCGKAPYHALNVIELGVYDCNVNKSLWKRLEWSKTKLAGWYKASMSTDVGYMVRNCVVNQTQAWLHIWQAFGNVESAEQRRLQRPWKWKRFDGYLLVAYSSATCVKLIKEVFININFTTIKE